MMIPGFEFWLSLAAQVSFFLIVSLALNLQFGYTGIPNFGIVLGVGGGGLAASVVSRILAQWLLGIPGDPLLNNAMIVAKINAYLQHDPYFAIGLFVTAMAVATVVGGVLGIAGSLPAIRLKGDYLAMILFMLGYLVEVVGTNDYYIAGGTNGMILPDPFVSFGADRFLVVTLITAALCIAFILYLRMLIRSPLARSLRAIRDNETTAASVGRNLAMYRLKAMGVGSAIGGLAGGLYAFYSLGISGATYSRFVWSYYPWLIVILGGAGNNLGVAIGAILLLTMQQFIGFYQVDVAAYLPFDIVYLQYLMLGVILILVMIYRPKGILPEKTGITIRKRVIES